MKLYKWFKIFNETSFNATGLVSRAYTQVLQNIGQKSILVTRGETLGMTYEGVFLSLLDGETKVEFDGHAMYRDQPTGDIYLGIEVPS